MLDVVPRSSTPVSLDASWTARLRRRLLHWYDGNARPLPWRASRDGYRVWVAEVMLQQTRVAVVVPAYERFLERLPTLAALAAASDDEVLSLWSGLGYYSRARSLRRAACLLLATGAGSFPETWESALALPGVGEYTAAAVLSIAYRRPYAAVDGNIARVLARLCRLPAADSRGEPYRRIAQQLLAKRRPGDWNQALMELGETICIPQAPRCDACPARGLCGAYRTGTVSRYPSAKRRPARQRVLVEMIVLRDHHGNLLLERGTFPYLNHLWLPPCTRITPGPAGGDGRRRRDKTERRHRVSVRHAILHRDFEVTVRSRTLGRRALNAMARNGGGGERRVFTAAEIAAIGRSSLLTKALRAVPGFF